jgi:hypothetical protein
MQKENTMKSTWKRRQVIIQELPRSTDQYAKEVEQKVQQTAYTVVRPTKPNLRHVTKRLYQNAPP